MTQAIEHHQAWGELPYGTLDEIIGTGTCLILAPHPDDESLGCGGLIAACVAAGRPPLIAILTDGTGSHPNSVSYPPARLRATREAEAISAVAHLGLAADRLIFLRQRDTAAPTQGSSFEAVVADIQNRARLEPGCTTILAPWRHDPHCDHEAASRIAAATGLRHIAYPVWGWTLPPDTSVPEPPSGGWRLDISPYVAAKEKAIRAHRSQYGGLITDDAQGFHLPPDLLTVFRRSFETFLSA